MLDVVRIAICDDEDEYLKELSDALNSYANKYRVDMGVDQFKNGVSLLKELGKRKKNKFGYFDIIILDYEMDYMNGVDVARAIREHDDLIEIVFVTKFEHFFRDAIEVGTSRFIDKPINKDKLYKYLNKYIRKQKSNTPITLRDNGELIRVKSLDIIYLEADLHRCHIHLKDKTVSCWKMMHEVLGMLPKPYFYRVHRSYAINMSHVDCTKDNMVILDTGERVPITKTKTPKFKRYLQIFTDTFSIQE